MTRFTPSPSAIRADPRASTVSTSAVDDTLSSLAANGETPISTWEPRSTDFDSSGAVESDSHLAPAYHSAPSLSFLDTDDAQESMNSWLFGASAASYAA